MQSVRALPPEVAPATVNDGMPTGFGVAFAAADLRARAALYYQQCAATVTRLRVTGTFGAMASAPRNVYCERTSDGVPIGGVFDIDTGFTKARRVTLVRLDGSRPRFVDAIDTARVVREARLVRDVTREFAASMRRQGRAFAVVPFSPGDGTSEGWVLPVSGVGARSSVLGGDIALIRDASGALRRSVDRAGSWRSITVPASGIVQLKSAEREVPAVADLVLARSLAERGRDVMLTTTVSRSTLVRATDPATGSRFSWEHARLAP